MPPRQAEASADDIPDARHARHADARRQRLQVTGVTRLLGRMDQRDEIDLGIGLEVAEYVVRAHAVTAIWRKRETMREK